MKFPDFAAMSRTDRLNLVGKLLVAFGIGGGLLFELALQTWLRPPTPMTLAELERHLNLRIVSGALILVSVTFGLWALLLARLVKPR